MAVLRPEATKLMESAGLKRVSKKDVKDILDDVGLGLEDTLLEMKFLRENTQNEHTKIRINESVLKMHGAMKEESTPPTININIVDPAADSKSRDSTNPILLPRELLNANAISSNNKLN